jgi:molecular chaperone HscB
MIGPVWGKVMVCWKCNEAVQGPICVGCGEIQPPPAHDPFALLGLPRKFSLDPAEVDVAWRQMSRRVHPDKFVGASPAAKRLALDWTNHVNEARRTLKEPGARALVLATGSPRLPEGSGALVPSELLEELFEVQSLISHDPASAAIQVAALVAAQEAELARVFLAWEAGTGGLDSVPSLVAQARYLERARSLLPADPAVPSRLHA